MTFACPPPSIFNNRDGASFLTYNCDNKKLYKLDGKYTFDVILAFLLLLMSL